jgi:hypothetical protein
MATRTTFLQAAGTKRLKMTMTKSGAMNQKVASAKAHVPTMASPSPAPAVTWSHREYRAFSC